MEEFSIMLKEAIQRGGQKNVEAFFEKHFFAPLNNELENDEKVPAETVRQKRKQTRKILTFLLTLGKN